MNFLNPLPVLENESIRLEPLKDSDLERLFQVASDPEIWEQHPSKDRYKRSVFTKYFHSAIESKSAFLIIDVKENKIIGTTRFYDFHSDDNSIAIGYTFIAKSYWGTNYNASIKKLMLDFVFKKVDKVYFHIGVDNFRSQKAVQKLGAKFIEVVNFAPADKKMLYCLYVIKKEEY